MKKKRVRNVINKVKLIDDIASNTIHITLHTYKITKLAWRTAVFITQRILGNGNIVTQNYSQNKQNVRDVKVYSTYLNVGKQATNIYYNRVPVKK